MSAKRHTHREQKRTPPPDDDPALRRTCTRCYRVRNWTECYCICGNPEFMLPSAAERELDGIVQAKRKEKP